MQKLVVKKLWVAGRASQDREEWREEVRAHYERGYDNKDETSEVQVGVLGKDEEPKSRR